MRVLRAFIETRASYHFEGMDLSGLSAVTIPHKENALPILCKEKNLRKN